MSKREKPIRGDFLVFSAFILPPSSFFSAVVFRRRVGYFLSTRLRRNSAPTLSATPWADARIPPCEEFS